MGLRVFGYACLAIIASSILVSASVLACWRGSSPTESGPSR